MSEQPPGEEPYQIPGTTAAEEPATLPAWPMTARDAYPFVQKCVA